ncbi:MAG: RagB/SusD family nutrient uptake outer membrane protein [Balneolaceae bacterium]
MKFSSSKMILVAAVTLCSVWIAGCSDLLEPNIYSELTPETFFNTEEDFNQALVSIYSPFNVDWGGIYNADPARYFGHSMITTDELHSQWHSTFTDFTWGAGTGQLNTTFNQIRTVSIATDVIHQLETSDANISDEVRNRYAAEARALRGWLNFILYDYFGPVPSRMDPAELYSLDMDARPTDEEFLQWIIDDLNAAIPGLRDSYHSDMANWGRMSKGAARMLLLRTYMNTHQWSQAEQVARDIMAMGIYSLQGDYFSIFNEKANPEIIHAIPGTAAAPNWWMPEVLTGNFDRTTDDWPIQFNPNFTGWTVYWMPWGFYDTFDPDDERLHGILDQYVHTNGSIADRTGGTGGTVMQGAIPLKFTILANPNNQGQPLDYPIFRYAEVLLSLAEAINEQNGGPTAEAEGYLNQIRDRVGLDPLIGLNQSEFRDALLRERGHEFHGEVMRRQDLIRHGKYIDNALERGKTNAQAHHVRFPIPNSVITEGDGVIEQNPGYN